VRTLRVHEELGVVPRPHPTRGHEERVVDEMVVGADGEQRRRQSVQIGVER
jgi:hypothetical protein